MPLLSLSIVQKSSYLVFSMALWQASFEDFSAKALAIDFDCNSSDGFIA